ncbi:MAG: sulfatase [Acidobacteria bacterium]|nr:sulfatase [Acidobacteriota bacterium]
MGKINRRRFIASAGMGAAALLLAGKAGRVAQAKKKPNFVVILGEGFGWSHTSGQMDELIAASKSSFYRTPNIENFARQGMRFANGYAASPRCTPSRASLFTGKTPALLKMTFVNMGGNTKRGDEDAETTGNYKLLSPRPTIELPASETTIGELLKSAGYRTAHFGKWHVGRTDPAKHGFDESDGPTNNGGPDNVPNPNPKEAFGMTERGIAFMTKQVRAGNPFYLQISHYGGRRAEDARPETYAAALKRLNGDARDAGDAAVVEDLDETIGTLLKKIDELGIAADTYVVYTADHGSPGQRANEPLRGGKGTLWEGGIRVPFIVRGPGIKANTYAHERVMAFDLLPTFAELAGVEKPLPDGVEGGSFAGILLGGGKGGVRRKREELVFHFPHYDNGNDGPATAIILGNLVAIKTYETGKLDLYDLEKDIGERRDLSDKLPDKAAEMERRMNAYLKEIGAQMPQPNPDYDPSKPEPDRRGKGGGNRDGRKEKKDRRNQ